MTRIDRYEKTFPHQLSGGVKRSVEIARALAAEQEVLLMDEPFSSLDAQARALMQRELTRLWETAEKTIIFVTHDFQEATLLSDRIAVMTARPGKIKTVMKVDVPRPRTLDSMSHPEFITTVKNLWTLISDDSTKS